MSKLAKETYFVLVADDSDNDRFLLKTAMRHAPRLQIIGETADGIETIAFLKGHADFRNRERYPLPDLLLLDLKMPLQDGFDVLEWLQTQPRRSLTVVVLTDSMQPDHIKHALDLGADLFQVKPKTNRDREAMILALEEYLIQRALAVRRELPLAQLRAASQTSAGFY